MSDDRPVAGGEEEEDGRYTASNLPRQDADVRIAWGATRDPAHRWAPSADSNEAEYGYWAAATAAVDDDSDSGRSQLAAAAASRLIFRGVMLFSAL